MSHNYALIHETYMPQVIFPQKFIESTCNIIRIIKRSVLMYIDIFTVCITVSEKSSIFLLFLLHSYQHFFYYRH